MSVEDPHPADPPDLGRHYADEAAHLARRARDSHEPNGRRLTDHEQTMAAMHAQTAALLSIGERMARLGYAVNRVHGALERLLVHQLPDEGPNGIGPEKPPIIVEPAVDPVPPPDEEGWTVTEASAEGAPREAESPRWECQSCHHDTRYAPGPGCQHAHLHEIPF